MLHHEFPAMGGVTEIQIVTGDLADAMRLHALFVAHERTMSRFLPDSELNTLNASAPRVFEASPLLFDVVSDAVGWACVTDGVFDPTIIDVLEAVGYDRPFERLSPRGPAVLDRPAAKTGRWRAISLDHDAETIGLPRGVRIDLGGIGKGYTVDRAIAALGRGANAMVNASGDLYAAGDGPEGEGWYVGVQDPFESSRDVAVLNVNDRGVATSGTTNRNWMAGDTRYHHLIDPRAATSSQSDLAAVTVVAPTATQADVLAKTALLLGSRAGLRFVERFSGAAAVAVRSDGELILSRGAAEYLA
jgi:FAD:protein FMN transferase